MSSEDPNRFKNHVRVGFGASKFLYVDITKHLLHDGEPEVVISGLGAAIAEAVSVVEMLKDQQMIQVTSIRTSRAEVENSRHKRPADKVAITVVKAPGFEARYDEQQRIREEKKAAAMQEADAAAMQAASAEGD